MAGAAAVPSVRSTDDGETEYTTTADSGSSSSTPDSVDIQKSANGGFIVRVTFPQPNKGPYVQPESHTFSSLAEVCSFLGEQFGESTPEAAPPDASQLPPASPQP